MMNNRANEIKKLQNSLRLLLKEVGWSQKKLAQKIIDDHNRSGVPYDRDVQTEYEKIKKLLTRSTTKPELLNHYINFLINHREVKCYKLVKLPDINLQDFPEWQQKILKEVYKISCDFFSELEHK